jgi:hypothetical protein
MGKENDISFLKDKFPVQFPGIKIIPTTDTEIKFIIHSLNTNNYSGYEEITSKISKVYSALISSPVAHIFNHTVHRNHLTKS